MEVSRSIQAVNNITEKEEKMLRIVMSKYDFDVISFYRVRSAYKVNTTTGNICLKKIRHGRKKVRNGSFLTDELRKNNFSNVPKYFKTKDALLIVKYKKLYFYASEWIDGEECSLNDINEARKCVRLLAEFHQYVNRIDIKKLDIKNNLKNWLKIFSNSLNDIEKFKKIIERKRIRNEFDLLYIDVVDHFYNRGMIAISLLNNSKYYQLTRLAEENKTICHDSFYSKNIVKKGDKNYITDFDDITIDLQVNDLGKFIRRLMYKNEYEWDFNKAKILIEAYHNINTLSRYELEVMLAMIIFPHKFWKLGKKRYIKHKSWSETKYLNKLNRLIRSDELQQKFLDDYLNYAQSYNY